ncbi:FAD-dependent oxidoreductase [Paraburkholderia sabiae]|uniref:NAD(P)/FAD-dependent oxidoreductase n=1 Tax=Paraburkholderia sabiae TaxID=273251 RepID=UPI001CB330A4|nr:NAD(P)/FAD-dependent oxidoreductase [Paraburkholderia sabiae]CAG9226335.1 FAD-dependent oxidoreductase [Paraburkholderia sabiae]
MISATDIVVVGGGPAGTSAAIWGALSGRSVTLIERAEFPRARPGETLHPGITSIFEQLGVVDAVEDACTRRHRGIMVNWGGRSEVSQFGASGLNEWLGYQVGRADLDAILMARARKLGVAILQPCRAVDLWFEKNVAVVSTEQGNIAAGYVIDASGQATWLARRERLQQEIASPPLRARYGYCALPEEWTDSLPRLSGDSTGWWWSAPISSASLAWMRLTWSAYLGDKPDSLADLRDLGPNFGADVTWKRVRTPAGPHFFICGDAAAIVDPCSSHGVLKALMSGMMAAFQINSVYAGLHPYKAAVHYGRWIETWWKKDVAYLSALYRQLDSGWDSRPRIVAKSD